MLWQHKIQYSFMKVLYNTEIRSKVFYYILIMERIINRVLLLSILLTLVLADCPFIPYPRRTVFGVISAQINNDPSLHNFPNQYEYALSQQLMDGSVSIAIGITSLELNSNGLIDFNIQNIPSTSLASLKFQVKITAQFYGWRTIRFSFFATQSSLFQVSTQQTNQFSVGFDNGKMAVYRPIPNYQNVQVDPIVRILLSGVSLKSRPYDEQYKMMIDQFESFKRFSSNGILVKYFTEAIQIKKSLQLRIYDTKILGRLFTFMIETNCQLTNLGFSFIIFSRKNVGQTHNFISDSFSFSSNEQFKISSLQNMEMLLTGLVGFKIPRQSLYSFSLGINNLGGQSYYNMVTNYKYMDLYFTYVAFQMKTLFVCQDCTNSPIIFQNKLCVEQCPRAYSVSESFNGKFCDKCDVDKLKIVDPQSGLCVCAKRHYLDKNSDSCMPCSYDCMSCQKLNRCLTCDNTLFQTKRTLTQQGRCKCPLIGFYDNKAQEDIVCQKCHPRCLTCNGPRPNNCLTCQINKQRDSRGFCVCKNGYIEDLSSNCICPPPRTLNQNGICIDLSTPCGPNKIEQFIDLTRRCICKPGFITILQNCIQCPQNAIFNEQSLKCECLKPTVQVNGQCRDCGLNQIYDDISKECVCKDGSFQTKDGGCTTCPVKMLLINQRCECAFNYYQQSPGVCRRCKRQTDGPKCKRNLY